ncbi:hypothetical protein F2P56_026606 [Juglans regia]|uniref:Uncharacterized protein n=2 Tax=Juglans regia TaxID=51240 RepID=A0A833T2E5_JUGRE|nr:uncharacterized protein LOC108998293 [Juglans regia]KAF5451501.1 hypothetical protein F2P56_026606 [Juglans regia]
MTTGESKPLEGEAPSLLSSSSSFSDSWKERIFIPTLVAGIVGGGAGLMSRHRKVQGLAKISSTYAANLAIVTGCYCGAREFVRSTRKTGLDDLLNSAIAGFGTGALLGRLQGGQPGAVRYSIIFAIVGTTADFAAYRVKPHLRSYTESLFGNNGNSQKDGWLKWPEWSPIQVLDEEAIAAKQAREQELYAQRVLGKLSNEKS